MKQLISFGEVTLGSGSRFIWKTRIRWVAFWQEKMWSLSFEHMWRRKPSNHSSPKKRKKKSKKIFILWKESIFCKLAMGVCVCAFFTWNVSFSTLKSITDFFAAFPSQWNSIPQAISRSAKKCKNVFFWNIINKWKLRWIRHIFKAKAFWVKVEKHHFIFIFYVRGFFNGNKKEVFFVMEQVVKAAFAFFSFERTRALLTLYIGKRRQKSFCNISITNCHNI